MVTHEYSAKLEWSGTTGSGYRTFSREHSASLTSRTDMTLSADPAFRGDVDLPNPEQLLVVAASSCQLLSFLGAAARVGVDVVAYKDAAYGKMPDESAPVSITEVELRPVIHVRDDDVEKVKELVVQARTPDIGRGRVPV